MKNIAKAKRTIAAMTIGPAPAAAQKAPHSHRMPAAPPVIVNVCWEPVALDGVHSTDHKINLPRNVGVTAANVAEISAAITATASLGHSKPRNEIASLY